MNVENKHKLSFQPNIFEAFKKKSHNLSRPEKGGGDSMQKGTLGQQKQFTRNT